MSKMSNTVTSAPSVNNTPIHPTMNRVSPASRMNKLRRLRLSNVLAVIVFAVSVYVDLAIAMDKYSDNIPNKPGRRRTISILDGERKRNDIYIDENYLIEKRKLLTLPLDDNISFMPTIFPRPSDRMRRSLSSSEPTDRPSDTPTNEASLLPSHVPSLQPSSLPSSTPTSRHSSTPTDIPTHVPSTLPESSPSITPSLLPSFIPSYTPTRVRSVSPSRVPSLQPTTIPSSTPSDIPTYVPSTLPSTLPEGTPSNVPSVNPSTFPSTKPTFIPTSIPSGIPTSLPSDIPSNEPSMVPSIQPSLTPSTTPTGIPTHEPSRIPSSKPTEKPSKSPSTFPSINPSKQLSENPTGGPSAPPSLEPTPSPSISPTSKPSFLPSISVAPSMSPSVSPSSTPSNLPTSAPSSKPTASPSLTPTVTPSMPPSLSIQDFVFDAQISLDNCDILNEESKEIFENVTEAVVGDQLEEKFSTALEQLIVRVNIDSMIKSSFGEFNTNSTGTRSLLQYTGSEARLWHRLQQTQTEASDDLLIGFSMEVALRSPITFNADEMQSYISETFDSDDKKTEYILDLQTFKPGDTTQFESINRVAVSIEGTRVLVIESPKTPDEPRGIVFYALVIGGGIAILLVFAFVWKRKGNSSEVVYDEPLSFREEDFAESQRTYPKIASTIQVDTEDQDISTLGDPQPAPNPAFGAFGGVSTNDSQSAPSSGGWDFNRAYGGGAVDESISTAAGKKSANAPRLLPYGNDIINDGISSSDQSSINQDSISLFTDDESFERMYGGEKKEDERIEIVAPPGKLGVVIDTPLSGVPMVHAIKDTSVLADKVQIGDKLVSVDGKDTTQMSAIKVSKLISSKAHSQRILVFTRAPS